MYLDNPPKIVPTRVFSEVPEALRKRPDGVVAGGRWQDGSPPHSLIEGPCFDEAGNLHLVDIPYGRIFKVSPKGEWTVLVEYDGEPNGLRRLPDGKMLVADYKQGILRLNPETGTLAPVVSRYRSERLKGPNDLIVARNGDVYFTDQGQTGLHDPTGRVFRLRADGQLDCVLANGAGPNGLALSADEKILYVAMTRDNAVWRVPLLPDGTTMKVGRFSSYFGIVGPDGILIDRAGNILVAHASLGCVFVHDRYGELIARIVSCRGRTVTNLAFGGADRKTLFITESETGSVLVADWYVPG
ncbi:SMP-30/gluconolactonase/LRE family protein [Manganibacter manganicus]|uniref:Gluconolactonase n=1 Tax=Manganibacter manganicus TaxID=1873176 RepID=A0A1V8RSG8_9HYPH|nr:SMP-30/gluconolactonase/LRE family protein [Pseudaminobacter manganicus]OQM76064.1 gluconolactonase [Pseudaminobacter manganicus]